MNSVIAVSCFLAALGFALGDGVGLGGHGLVSAPIINHAAVAPVYAPVVHHTVPVVRTIVTPVIRPVMHTVPVSVGWGHGLRLGGYGLYGRGSGYGSYGLYGRGLGYGSYSSYGRGSGYGSYGHGLGGLYH